MGLTEDELTAVRASLRRDNPSATTLLRVEKAGDRGFDFIVHALESGCLATRERANALLRLALIARHARSDRKREVFAWAIRLLADDDVFVRSQAAIFVANYVPVLEGLVNEGGPMNVPIQSGTTRDSARRALRDALDRGLDADAQRVLRERMASR